MHTLNHPTTGVTTGATTSFRLDYMTTSATTDWVVPLPVSVTMNVTWGSTTLYWDNLAGALRRAPARKPSAPTARNHRGGLRRADHAPRFDERLSQAELVALQLLRRLVPEQEWRRYLRYGFINVQGASGLVYSIAHDERLTVRDRGQRVASLCVHLRQRGPAADAVAAKLLFVEHREAELWRRANITWDTSVPLKDRALLAARVGDEALITQAHRRAA